MTFYEIGGFSSIFSADNSDRNYILQSLKHVEVNLKPQFLIKSGHYIVPISSNCIWFFIVSIEYSLRAVWHADCLTISFLQTEKLFSEYVFPNTKTIEKCDKKCSDIYLEHDYIFQNIYLDIFARTIFFLQELTLQSTCFSKYSWHFYIPYFP